MRNQPTTRKYHIIYKTIRLDGSGAYYIGMHSTDVLDDRYLGSGIILNKSIKKYGRALHKKEILEYLPSRRDLAAREADLVSEAMIADPRCMNITLGGGGASPGDKNHFFGKTHSREAIKKMSAARLGKSITDDVKALLSKASSAALSKRYLVIGPDGSEYEVKGLKAFCLERGLVYSSLHGTIRSGVSAQTGRSPGWLVKRP